MQNISVDNVEGIIPQIELLIYVEKYDPKYCCALCYRVKQALNIYIWYFSK